MSPSRDAAMSFRDPGRTDVSQHSLDDAPSSHPQSAAAASVACPVAPPLRSQQQPRAADFDHSKQPGICPTDDDSVLPRKNTPGKIDKHSMEYFIKSGIAGGLAGCAAKTVVSPLDRVKILFQASNPRFQKYTGSWTGAIKAMREIYVLGGVRGLFRGHSATLLRIFPYAGIKFLAYEQVRAYVIPGPEYETHLRRFLSGSLAGTVSVFCTYPLEVIRVRLAFETKATAPGGQRSTLTSICRTIYHEHPRPPAAHPPEVPAAPLATATPAAVISNVSHAAEKTLPRVVPRAGLANFYRGFTPTLWGMLPYAGCSFLTHDLAGDMLRHRALAAHTTLPGTATARKPAQLTSWAELLAGGLAGFVSQTASYPLEVVRRRMQVGGAVGDGHRLRMAEVARAVFAEAGWRGFFVGLGIGYFKVVPMSATSFFVYERAKYWLGI